MIAWTRVHATDDFLLDLTLAVSPRHLRKVRRVGHSPTREKKWNMTWLNRGVNSPINCRHYLLSYLPYTWRPTGAATCVRVVAWPFATWPRCAPLAPHVGHPWPCHVALEPRRIRAVARVPCVASPASPLATLATTDKYPLFLQFY